MQVDYTELMLTFPLFEGYTARGAQTVVERGAIRELGAGEVLFEEGDAARAAVLVLAGLVQRSVVRESRTIPVGTSGPSHVLADVQVLGDLPHPTSARTLEPTVVLEWDNHTFRRLVVGDALFGQRIIHQTAVSLARQAQAIVSESVTVAERVSRAGR